MDQGIIAISQFNSIKINAWRILFHSVDRPLHCPAPIQAIIIMIISKDYPYSVLCSTSLSEIAIGPPSCETLAHSALEGDDGNDDDDDDGKN